MIISAAPFRISFAGGGSDIACFYRRHKGAVISTTITKYVYVSVHPYFNTGKTLVKYSKNELVDNVRNIRHPVFRDVIGSLWPEGGIEVVSTADIPSGTGLGSSSTFTVALLHALYAYRGKFCSKEKLAHAACETEIEHLHEPIGKQDQYAAAYGGLNLMEFNPDGTVVVTPLTLNTEAITGLEENLLLFYTGDQRKTGGILKSQNRNVSSQATTFSNMVRMTDLAYLMRDQLLSGDLDGFARALNEGWRLKQSLSPKISNSRINSFYQRALKHGALGGKLLGAGGGGFLLLYCEKNRQARLRRVLAGLYELPFKFDWAGSRIIYVGEHHTKKGFFS